MTVDEYKIARVRSGIRVVDNWCRALDISEDTHKSISSGRLAVSEAVANRIAGYFLEVEARAKTLRDELYRELQIAYNDCDVVLDLSTFNISISLPDGRNFMVEHCGVDTMNGWGVYNIDFGQARETLVLLHARAPRRQKKANDFHWYMWRGPFSGIQSYWHEVNSELLVQCLAS